MPKNIINDVTALFASPSPFIQVQATAEIVTTKGHCIAPGNVIIIDPTRAPEDDQMVLVGDSIQPFAGQQHGGVVTGFMS